MKIKGKRILVTGGAGFIGSHVSERLIQEGAEVVIFDNFSTGKLSNLDNIKNNVEIITGKTEDYKRVLLAIKNCDVVIHEAFPYGMSGMGLNEQYIEDGIIGTFNILKSSVKNNVDKVVNVSSVAAYGILNNSLVREEQNGNPFLPYGVTKLAGELYCKTFSKLYNLDTVSLRYFYVYGPRYAKFDHNAMVNFLNNVLENKPLTIYGNGSQIRDYTYISDVVEGTILATKKDNIFGEVYNISQGNGITILQLAKKIIKLLDKNVEIKFAKNNEYKYSDKYCHIPIGLTKKIRNKWIDERNYVGDITKAKGELNYEPKIGLDQGIKLTAEWLKSIKG